MLILLPHSPGWAILAQSINFDSLQFSATSDSFTIVSPGSLIDRALSAEEAAGLGLNMYAHRWAPLPSDPSVQVPARVSIYLVLVAIAAGVAFLYLSWLFITFLWSKCHRGISSKGPSSIEAGLQAGSVAGSLGASSTLTDNLVEKGAPQAELRG